MMKPTSKPYQTHRFCLTFDFLIEDITAETIKRWNEHEPEHMQMEIEEEGDFIAAYREFVHRLVDHPRIHDFIAGWMETRADVLAEAMASAFDSTGDQNGDVDSEIIQQIIAGAASPEDVAGLFEVSTKRGQTHYEHMHIDYIVNLSQIRPLHLSEQVLDASGQLKSEREIDLSQMEIGDDL